MCDKCQKTLLNRRPTPDYIVRLLLFSACELFCLFSFVRFLTTEQLDRIALCAVSAFLVCVPPLFERITHMRIHTVVYSFFLLYAIGAMLGHSYKLYYMISWWDTALHIAGGIAFAMLGAYLPSMLNRGNPCSPLLCALFAVCFSAAIAVLWEGFEYGMDAVFAMDMQNDTVVTAIHSYKLGNELGVLGHMDGMKEVSVNGLPLGLNGYLDIGLVDTMTDMLVETLGAILFATAFLLDGGRHPVFRKTANLTNGEQHAKEQKSK